MTIKCYSTNEEDFNFTEIADAIEYAIDGAEVGEITTIYEGDAICPSASDFVSGIADDLYERAHDDGYSEYVDDWPNTTTEQNNELDELVGMVVDGWAKKHGVQPTFYRVENIKERHVRLLDEEGNYEFVEQQKEAERADTTPHAPQ